MTDELLRYRSQFPILERTTYLMSNSLGAMQQGVYDAMKGYADTWATRGIRAWEERWWMLAAQVGDGITVPVERLLDAIDEQTLLVPVSHVIFRSSYIQDAEAIIERAHKVGAHVVLDTFQSLGTVPVDVQALNVDFACGGVLKWLCGGPGVGYLYVRPDLGNKLEPKFTGWFAHRDSMAFETGPIRYTDPPFRFMNGTTHIPSLEAARPGLKIIREAGVEKIREKSKRQIARLIELADKHGWRVNTPRDPEKRGGTVSIEMPDSQEVCRDLLSRDILVDWRPKAGVRFSPHFYNTDQELETAIADVEEMLKERAVAAR